MADDKADPTLDDVCEELRGIHGALKAIFWVVFIGCSAIAGLLLGK